MSQPSQPGPQGGVTTERSFLDPAISGKVQDAFTGSLDRINSSISGLPNSMQYAGSYNPGSLGLQTNLGLQTSVNQNKVGGFNYSNQLDPLVQAQLSGAQQETAQALGAKNDQIADQLRTAPGNNRALIASVQSDNTREAALQSNPYRNQALQAQTAMDAQKYGLNLQGTNANNAADLNAANFGNNALMTQGQFANQAKMSERSADQSAFQTNLGAMAQNNQTRLSALSPQMQYMGMLGQGMLQTTPRGQANFTMDDIARLREDPELMQVALGSGLIDQATLERAGINNTTAPSQNIQAQINAMNSENQRLRDAMRARGMVF